jgi:predicted 3-demethylubiquinone-9 3-methyltransferase (glyoxalase superfamily)/uncharacterized protein YndB with AHSA1/START domain
MKISLAFNGCLPVTKNNKAMETKQKTMITVKARINAPVGKVWKFWTTPEDIQQWNNASSDWHTPHAQNDLRTGGEFHFRMEARDGSMGFDFGGVYEKVILYHQIISTLGDGRKVNVLFTIEDDKTEITESFEAEEENPVEMQREGWQAILDNFKNYAELKTNHHTPDIVTHQITPCLWFESQAEEAAKFYTSVFKNSRILKINRYGKEGFEIHGQKEGSVLTVDFQINKQSFTALNGGPIFKFNEAISFQVYCDSQEEIDDYWSKLTKEGQEGQCGWLKDKFGVSWQIIPSILPKLMSDPYKADKVMKAFLQMKKFDIEKLVQA